MGTLKPKRCQSLAFADDIVLLASSPEKIQGLSDVVSDFCKKWRMTVNINKTKLLVFKKNYLTSVVGAVVYFNGTKVEQVIGTLE